MIFLTNAFNLLSPLLKKNMPQNEQHFHNVHICPRGAVMKDDDVRMSVRWKWVTTDLLHNIYEHFESVMIQLNDISSGPLPCEALGVSTKCFLSCVQ